MNVSVVVPTFNRKHLLQAAVDSALAQAGPGLEVEIVVADDASQDGTLGWLGETYGADARVRAVVNSRAKGPAGARNSGILAARFPFVALLDSDDVFLPGHLAAAAGVFSAHPEVGVAFGPARYERDGRDVDYMGANFAKKVALAPVVAEDDDAWVFGEGFFAHLLEHGCYFNLSTVVLRADAARQLMNESLRIAEDYEFWMRLARTVAFACLKTPQIVYRLHDGNVSFDDEADPAGHAPMLLRAWDIVQAWPDLERDVRRRVRRHVAQEYFDWAWRCGRQGRFAEAFRLHGKSMRHGLKGRNLLAMLKLLCALPARRSRSGDAS